MHNKLVKSQNVFLYSTENFSGILYCVPSFKSGDQGVQPSVPVALQNHKDAQDGQQRAEIVEDREPTGVGKS